MNPLYALQAGRHANKGVRCRTLERYELGVYSRHPVDVTLAPARASRALRNPAGNPRGADLDRLVNVDLEHRGL